MRYTLGEKLSIAVVLTIATLLLNSFLAFCFVGFNPLGYLNKIPVLGNILNSWYRISCFVYAFWCTIPLKH